MVAITNMDLPIVQVKNELLSEIRKNAVTVVIGETGSGKSTRLPQFINDSRDLAPDGLMLAITQPRRLAAVQVATRVAQEQNCKIGTRVGYAIRFEDCTSRQTRIKYMTDGILLKEAQSGNHFENYHTVIIDEAHERSVASDLLLSLLKIAQENRNKKMIELRVIIMSASLNAIPLSQFFNNAPVVYVPGRQYPVKLYYTAHTPVDLRDAILTTIIQLHTTRPVVCRSGHRGGDILVFLTGEEEINDIASTLDDIESSLPRDSCKWEICKLYAAQTDSSQAPALKFLNNDKIRKIVLCTNIAETSITLPGITFVVDPGRTKITSWHPQIGITALDVVGTSKQQSLQRAGRAGRLGPGECFRLWSEGSNRERPEENEPEITRVNAGSLILDLAACGIEDLHKFSWLTPPHPVHLKDACQILQKLGAIKVIDNCKIKGTCLGNQMAKLPLSPPLSHFLINASAENVLHSAIDLVAALSVENLFMREKVAVSYLEWAGRNVGDHAVLIDVLQSFSSECDTDNFNAKEWCKSRNIHHRNLNTAILIRKQLRDRLNIVNIVKSTDLSTSGSGCDYAKIVTLLKQSHPHQIAFRRKDGLYQDLSGERKSGRIWMGSVLNSKAPKTIMYSEALKIKQNYYFRNVSVIEGEDQGSHAQIGEKITRKRELSQKSDRESTLHSSIMRRSNMID